MSSLPHPGSVDDLLARNDDRVQQSVIEFFLVRLKMAPSVFATFFPDVRDPSILPVPAPADPSFVDQLASALVCSSIARTTLFGFADCVFAPAADSFWQSREEVSGSRMGARSRVEARILYDHFFTFGDSGGTLGLTFAIYLNDPGNWAKSLADAVTAPAFINVEIAKLLAHEPRWLQKLNLILYMLHRLEEGQRHVVAKVWSDAYPSIVDQWETYNYAPLFTVDEFVNEVNQAISVQTDHHWVDFETEHVFGEAVQDFLEGLPKQMGMITGRRPDNVQVSHSAPPP